MARPRSAPLLRQAFLITTLAMTVLSTSVRGQEPSPSIAPTLDGAVLVSACQENALDDTDLAACLDVVTRILVPGYPIPDLAIGSEGSGTFEPIQLAGRGDKLARIELPAGVPAYAQIRHGGRANFVVWVIGADGSREDLAVNVIGNYAGSVLIGEDPLEPPVALEINADGKWQIALLPVASAPAWDGRSVAQGKGDTVVRLAIPVSGLAGSAITHGGRANFVVKAMGSDGDYLDLLINEIGRYSGEVLLPEGTAVLQILADGSWTLGPLQ